MNNYHFYEEQGKGKYSLVFKARKKKTLEYVAIKKTERSRKKKILNQAKILTQLTHPNIIKFYDWFETKNHLWIITEFCAGGDLLTLIEQDKSLPEKTVKSFIKQILLGLQYLHSNGIIFSDLKPANILINQYGNLKLADLGSARKLIDMMQNEKESKKGTPCYLAPELFEDSGIHSFQSDLWAVGCIMYQLAQGHPPFVSSTFPEIVNLVVNSQTPKIDTFSDSYNDLLTRLLIKQPENRITWKQLLSHPWLKPDLPNFQIPQQPHFQAYLQNRKLTKKKVDILRMSQNLKKNQTSQNYNSTNINTNNRREQLNFGEQDNIYAEYIEEDEQQKDYNNNKEKLQIDEEQKFPKNNVKPEKEKFKRPSIPQVDDSSNLNIELQKINKNNLIPIDQILIHQSDSVVKPIIGNKDIEVAESFTFSKGSLGFPYIEPQDLIEGLTNGEMEVQLKKIYDGMLGDNKIHVIGYFETLIQNSQISNFLIQSYFIPLFLKLVKSYKQPVLRAKICQILGLLIRHATVIEADVLKFNLTNTLIQVLKDKSEKVRRKSMAALGQFLFYGATQVDQKLQIWDISPTCFNCLLKVLRNNTEDQVVRFYVCKTIENITAQAKTVGLRFAQLDILLSLYSLYTSTKLELMKVSIIASFHHSIILNQSLLEPLLEKVTIKHIVQCLENSETNTKIVQLFTSLINMQLHQSPSSKFTKSILEDQSLTKGMIQQLQNQSQVIKGRILLYFYFLLKHNFRNVIYVQQSKFFQIVEKQLKENHKYLVQNLQHLIVLLQENIGFLIKLIQDGIAYTKKNPYPLNETKEQFKKRYNYGTVLLNLMNCSVFQDNFQNNVYIQQLFNMIDTFESQSSHNLTLESMKNTIMQICEKIVSNAKLTENLQEYISQTILPKLISKIIKGQQSDLRFNCMKLVIYLIGFYLSEQYLYNSAILSSTNKTIIQLINEKLFPSLQVLLLDRQPIPSFTLKLLALLFQLQPTFIKSFKKISKINLIFDYYDHSSNKLTQHTLKIIQSFCTSGQLSIQQLLQLIPKTKKILSHYIETQQYIFIEFPLQIFITIIQTLFTDKKENLTNGMQEIENIFELVVSLQGCDDIVVREKAIQLIRLLLNLKIFSTKCKWLVAEKLGLQNYLNYLKISGRKYEKDVIEKMKLVEDKNIQSLLREIQTQ